MEGVLLTIRIMILAVAASIVLIPTIVLGTWWVVMTTMIGLVDGAIWLLDARWKTTGRHRGRAATPLLPRSVAPPVVWPHRSALPPLP